MKVKDYIAEQKDYLIEMRRYFHSHPEVSLKEFNTCRKIEEELSLMGIPFQKVGETGIYAWIDGKKSANNTVVALRSDIDALAMEDLKDVPYRSQNSGVCHACGHDAHTAILLGAAKVLKKKEQEFSGQVRLLFQPAEEIGQGARLFVQEHLLQGVSRVFAAHVTSRLKTGEIALTKGPQYASCDYFKINITGKGAHVSTPHLGVDAAYIAAQIVINLQAIVSRNTAPLDSVVVGVGTIKAGTQYNIVAEHAELEGTTRSFLPHIREYTNNRVKEIAEQTASIYGADAQISFSNFAAPLVNDDEAVDEVITALSPILSESQIVRDYEKALGADDFADFLAVTKGMYAFVGTADEEIPGSDSAHHHGSFDIGEEALLLACNAYVDYTLWVLEEK